MARAQLSKDLSFTDSVCATQTVCAPVPDAGRRLGNNGARRLQLADLAPRLHRGVADTAVQPESGSVQR